MTINYTASIAIFEAEAERIRQLYVSKFWASDDPLTIEDIELRDEAIDKCLFAIEMLHKAHKNELCGLNLVGQCLNNKNVALNV